MTRGKGRGPLRRWGIPALILTAAILAGTALAADSILVAASRTLAESLAARAREAGFRNPGIAFTGAEVLAPRRLAWDGVVVRADLSGRGGPLAGKAVLNLDELTLICESLWQGRFRVLMDGVDFQVFPKGSAADGGGPEKVVSVQGARASFLFSFSPLRPDRWRGEIRETASRLKDFLRQGRADLPATFEGEAAFPFRGGQRTVRISVRQGKSGSYAAIDEEDVMLIAEGFGFKRPLTGGEVALLARHPLRAARLLEIRNHSRSRAAAAHAAHGRVSEDAYRHVLWSYILTKEYGADFAKTVTDAHEVGRTGNTEAEKAMDLANNEVGRRYARAGYGEEAIPGLVMTDPDVVAKPER